MKILLFDICSIKLSRKDVEDEHKWSGKWKVMESHLQGSLCTQVFALCG